MASFIATGSTSPQYTLVPSGGLLVVQVRSSVNMAPGWGSVKAVQTQKLSGSVMVDTFFWVNLQRAVDEKFRCVEEKEEEARRLQLLLREKERDLDRQRCVLANNEETITVRAHTQKHTSPLLDLLTAPNTRSVCVRAWRCWCEGRLWSWSRCLTPGGTFSGSSRRARSSGAAS